MEILLANLILLPNILIDFDKKIRNQGIVKTVNKENFEKYAETVLKYT